MTACIGIDLSPSACRVIELAGPMGSDGLTRVASFALLSTRAPAASAKLRTLSGRPAAVIVWRARSDHRQMTVRSGSYQRMRSEACARLRDLGMAGPGTLADIAPAGPRVRGPDRLPVLIASASAVEVRAALRPLVAAGVDVRSVLTPAAALQALASTRRAHAIRDAFEAYVALTEMAACVAVIRNRVLMAARDVPWGFLDTATCEPKEREELAGSLAREIQSFVAACGLDVRRLGQISICGGLPDLRSMTAPLMEQLDVEVETLDSMVGIDEARLPQPSAEFREGAAALRLAWAAAAVRHPSLDLYRDRRRRRVGIRLSRAAVVAGAATGLGIGWWAQGAWRPAERPVSQMTQVSGPVNVRVPIVPRTAVILPRAVVIVPRAPKVKVVPVELTTRVIPPATPVIPVMIVARRQPAAVVGNAPVSARLETILYAPERKAAIVDGRIVEPGDEVKGLRVIDIVPDAVLLRDAQGRLKRLSLIGSF